MSGTTNFPTTVDTEAGLRPGGENVQQSSQQDANLMAAVLAVESFVQGSGYKIKRGVARPAAAATTVVTGLTTVVAAVACFDDPPTINQLFLRCTIGDQAGSPAAGSIIITTYKPTAVNDVTPTASTDWSDDTDINWIAVGT